MAATSRGLSTPVGLRPSRRVDASPLHSHGLHFWKHRSRTRSDCSCSSSSSSDSVIPIRKATPYRKSVEKSKAEDWRFDPKRSCTRVRIQATPAALPFLSSEYVFHVLCFSSLLFLCLLYYISQQLIILFYLC